MNAQRREGHERFSLLDEERSERTRRRKAGRSLLEELGAVPLLTAGYYGEEALVDVEEVRAAVEAWSFRA